MINFNTIKMSGYGRFFTHEMYMDRLVNILEDTIGEFEMGYMPKGMIKTFLEDASNQGWNPSIFQKAIYLGQFEPNVQFIYEECMRQKVPFGAICPGPPFDPYIGHPVYTLSNIKDCVTMLYQTGGITRENALTTMLMEEFI